MEWLKKNMLLTAVLVAAGVYVWHRTRASEDKASGVRAEEQVLTADPWSWDRPVSIAAGAGDAGPLESAGTAPWDRL